MTSRAAAHARQPVRHRREPALAGLVARALRQRRPPRAGASARGAAAASARERSAAPRARRRAIAADRPARARRAEALDELQHAEPRDVVGAVVGQPQQRDEVLHVRGLEVPQAAVLDERDSPPGELELEQVAVVRGAREDRLGAQLGALLARLQDAVRRPPRPARPRRAATPRAGGRRPAGRRAAVSGRRAAPARRRRSRRPAPAGWSGSCAPASPPACPGSARGSRGCAPPRRERKP